MKSTTDLRVSGYSCCSSGPLVPSKKWRSAPEIVHYKPILNTPAETNPSIKASYFYGCIYFGRAIAHGGKKKEPFPGCTLDSKESKIFATPFSSTSYPISSSTLYSTNGLHVRARNQAQELNVIGDLWRIPSPNVNQHVCNIQHAVHFNLLLVCCCHDDALFPPSMMYNQTEVPRNISAALKEMYW